MTRASWVGCIDGFTTSTCSCSTSWASRQFDRAGGELLFNLLTERYERRSVIVTHQPGLLQWVQVFGGDEKLTTALLDRLAHHATVITTKGKSFRMRKKGANEDKNHGDGQSGTLPKTGRKA